VNKEEPLRVSLCSVDTAAGGLVRVVKVNDDGSTTTLLDDSYTNGTAPCTLETKMRWKLGDKETRGPPPFKAPRPEGLWDGRINELLKSVGVAAPSFSGFDAAVAPLDAALKKKKDAGIIPGHPTVADLIALLETAEQGAILPTASSTVEALATATGVSDGVAVANWKKTIEKEAEDCSTSSC